MVSKGEEGMEPEGESAWEENPLTQENEKDIACEDNSPKSRGKTVSNSTEMRHKAFELLQNSVHEFSS